MMPVDPTLLQVADDTATASQFAAAMGCGDAWEAEHILDGIDDLPTAKRLFVAGIALHVNFAQTVCQRSGVDPCEC